jgi:Metallo-beta-lactamase superfamily
MARKTTRDKTAKSRASGKSATPATNAVTIRMYCQGLGDCFLLSFPKKTGIETYKVLIDCGVLQKTPDEAERLRHVADDLFAVTGGKIDLLVITHEHWDHIAGFSHANDVFSKISFARVWLSWAENPNDADAQIVKKELGKKKKQVKAALKVAGMLGLKAGGASPVEKELETTEQMMNFIGPDDAAPGPAPAAAKTAKSAKADGADDKKKRLTLGEAMDWLRAKVQPSDWCVPGEVRSLKDVDGVKVYVLGPPKATASIR